MRKKLLALALILPIATAQAKVSPTEYREILEEGIEIGMNIERKIIALQLKQYEDLLRSILDYKKFMFEGKVPPPVIKEELKTIKTADGFRVVKEYRIAPAKLENFGELKRLETDLEQIKGIIPEGYWIYLDTGSMPLKKVFLVEYLLQKDGYEPILLPEKEKLVITVESRLADAKYLAKKLKDRYKIEGIKYARAEEYEYIKQSEEPEISDIIAQINYLSSQIIEKEEEIMKAVKNANPEKIASYVYGIEGLEKALEEIKKRIRLIEAKGFRKDKLERDLSIVIDKIRRYRLYLEGKYIPPAKPKKEITTADVKKASVGEAKLPTPPENKIKPLYQCKVDTRSPLNIRNKPWGKKIGRVKPGTILNVYGKEGKWLFIGQGYVYGDYCPRIVIDKHWKPKKKKKTHYKKTARSWQVAGLKEEGRATLPPLKILSDTAEPPKTYCKVDVPDWDGWLNVRRYPNGEVVKRVPDGAKLEVLGRKGNWIKTPEGYVYKRYCKLIEGEE